jgi:hypothetical protein
MLWALLLYLAGAVVHPFSHLQAVGAGVDNVVLTSVGHTDDESENGPAGGEQHSDCVACKLTRLGALPAQPAVAAEEVLLPVGLQPAASIPSHAPFTASSSQPRAPPHI